MMDNYFSLLSEKPELGFGCSFVVFSTAMDPSLL